MTQHSTVNGKGIFKLILWLSGWLMKKANCKAGEKEFASLKRLLEENGVEDREPA